MPRRMRRIQFCPKLQQNRLLSTLSKDECERICPHLEKVRVDAGKTLCEPDVISSYVYFPLDCFVSLSHFMEDDSAYAMALVGHEGMLGVSHFLEGMTMPYTAVCQSSGHIIRIDAGILRREFGRGDQFHRLLLRYSQALMTYMGLTAACNRHHALSEQVSHLLLQIRDRVSSDEIALTQECIADLLGVRRERVNKVALELQEAGAIRYARGRIVILDQLKLSAQSCGCYASIKKEFSRLLETDAAASTRCDSAVE